MASKVHLILYPIKVPTGLIFEFLRITAIWASKVIKVIPHFMELIQMRADFVDVFNINKDHLYII